MSTSIYDFPPVERKYVAVRRYKNTIGGEIIFKRLLEHLGLTETEFIQKYGDELIGNPTLFNHEIVMMVCESFRSIRKRRSLK